MAPLTSKKRRSLRKSQFALPKGSGPDRSKNQYPVDTKSRARAAKGRALQQRRRGKLTSAQYKVVVRKANAALRRFGVKNPSGPK
jgi:hypothetical protein